MKTYKIGVVWQMYGSVEVEANSLEEAVKEVVFHYLIMVNTLRVVLRLMLKDLLLTKLTNQK
jgi:hypothetical protein